MSSESESSEQWTRIQSVFDGAVALPEEEREAYVHRECADAPTVASEVLSLLQADASERSLLDASAVTPVSAGFALEDDEPLAAGTMLGEYRIEAELGAGGFGRVYRAVQPVIRKPVAIKVLYARYAASREYSRRFVNEARSVNEIGHPDIIDIFAFGQTPDGQLYFVMELIEAPSLAAVLAERGRLPPAETVTLLRRLAEAVDAAHRRGVVHRDLKPANVLLVEDAGQWRPKLLDFGIAKLRGSESTRSDDDGPTDSTTEGTIMGTPAYMSPEQARGLSVGPPTDVYALGIIAFELLTGRVPFRGGTPLDTLLRHGQDPVPSVRAEVPGLPPSVDDVLARWLAKRAEDRPASCVEAVEPLEALLEAPAPTRASRWGLAVVAAVAVVLVGGLALALADGGDVEPTRGAADEPVSETPEPSSSPVPPPLGSSGPVEPVEPIRAAGASSTGDATETTTTTVVTECRITIAGPPRGTQVMTEDGARLGGAPGTVTLPCGDTPVSVVLRARGHKDERLDVTPDRAEQALRVRMQPARKLNPDLESPFKP